MRYLLVALVLLIYLVFAWFVGSWMQLHGQSLWILRGGLALLGSIAAAAWLWFRSYPEGEAPQTAQTEGDLDHLFRAAEMKLRSARPSHGSGIGSLPMAMVIGFGGSGKTSVMTHSDLNAELLAGAVGEESAVTPTSIANIWYASGTVFVEPSGAMLVDEKRWSAFVQRTRPSRLKSTFSASSQAARTVVVCFDAETLLSDPLEIARQAKLLRGRLSELASALGVQLPVYVLFTRSDRIPHFTDFVSTLKREEAESVLGCTLRFETLSPGTYVEQQSARVGQAFDELVTSLCRARLDLLGRGHDERRAGCAYEFPRQFRKLRPVLSDFLVELCRPAQFGFGTVLRGYYFSGVRPIKVERTVPAAPTKTPAQKFVSHASQVFRTPVLTETLPVAEAAPSTVRRVPQWVFLRRFFGEVLLKDQVAIAASGISVHNNIARRILLAGAACLSLVLAAGFTVSWLNNRALSSAALVSARSLAVDPLRADPSLKNLQRLEQLRGLVETLAGYRQDGAPIGYRWGLYSGDRLYPQLLQLYFHRFQALLLADTQARLVERLRSLPAKPASDYGFVYDSLKAYLIITSNHDRSTAPFLAPVLLDRWSAGRNVESATSALAARQFAFYAAQLKQENPFSSSNDNYAVARARDYLAQFGGVERIYRAILSEASNRVPAIVFNQQYPNARAALVDAYPVSGAFTAQGWRFVTDAMRNPAQYFSGEQWVLGTSQDARINLVQTVNQLHSLYAADFLSAWRAYLKAASLVPYASLADASRKLDLLSGNRSPLLALLALASQNTAVDDPAIANAFQAVQAVVPPSNTQTFLAPSNQAYMSALLALQSSLEQSASRPADTNETPAAPILSAAANAKIAAKQLAQSFRPDPAGRVDVTVAKLLEDPITKVETLAQAAGPDQLKDKLRGLCSQLNPLFSKYPFKRDASTEVSVAELNAALRKSDGLFWNFYAANLQKIVVRHNAQFVTNPAAPFQVTPAALVFLDRIAQLSDALYPDGAEDPQFAYTLTPEPAEGIQQLGISLDGETLSYSGGPASPQKFRWKGNASHQAIASVRFGNGPDLVWSRSDGPWAVFHLFDKADRTQASASGETSFEWTIRIGKDPVTLGTGKALTVRLGLSGMSAPIFADRGYFNRLACSTLGHP